MKKFAVLTAVFGLFLPNAALAAGLTATSVIVYHPSHMHVKSSVAGYCWTDSIAVDRADAFRCMVGDSIYDPCFVSGSSRVACPSDLVKDQGTVIKLTKALPPRSSGQPTDNAWAFELQSGALCQIGTGTITPGFPYYCSGPPVCAEPRRSGSSSFYETDCGQPVSAVKVTSRVVKRVRTIWK